MYYNECEKCGAHLDPGEHCDCEEEKDEKENILQIKRSCMDIITNDSSRTDF